MTSEIEPSTPDRDEREVFVVEKFNSGGEPLGNPERFYVLKDAEREFDRNVRNYSFLVKAESKPIDDIEAYADRIDYRKVDPDCCMNCEFCSRKREIAGPRRGIPAFDGLVCINPENFKFFENMVFPQEYGRYMNKYFQNGFHPSMHDPNHNWWIHGELVANNRGKPSSGWELGAPPCDCSDYVSNPHDSGVPSNPHFHSLEVHPRVDFNGHCKHYRRRKIQN